MATKKIEATNGRYGHSTNKDYTNLATNHLFVGKSPSTSNYRSRLTFPPMSSLASVGDSRIKITDMTLYLRRNDGGPNEIYAGCSASSAWGAALDATGACDVSADTGWYSIDLSACADAVVGYTGNWYIHLTGDSDDAYRRTRFDGIGNTYKPYILVTWEYIAATITPTSETVVLDEETSFEIKAEEGSADASYTLQYYIGEKADVIESNVVKDSSGTTVIKWKPPLNLASEITDDNIGIIEVRMTVYDASGKIIRTERCYQTVEVPSEILPSISDDTSVLFINSLNGSSMEYGLAGYSYFSIKPIVSVENDYGANIVSVTADIIDKATGSSIQTVQWTYLTDNGDLLYGEDAATSLLPYAGEFSVNMVVEDSRGRTVNKTWDFYVYSYSLPEISVFSVERCEEYFNEDEGSQGYQASDLGANVWVNLDANVANVMHGGDSQNILNWQIIGTKSDGDTSITASINDNDKQNISVKIDNDVTIFPATVPGNETWEYVVIITDNMGGVSKEYCTVSPARANFALAESKFGAAFGGIPHGTAENPMLESWYPFYAYASIYDRKNTEVIGARMVAQQEQTNVSVPHSVDTPIKLFTAEEDGLYIVSFSTGWASDADGARATSIYKMAGEQRAFFASSRMIAGGSAALHQNAVALVNAQAGETIYGLMWQNGNNANNAYYYYQVAQIGK